MRTGPCIWLGLRTGPCIGLGVRTGPCIGQGLRTEPCIGLGLTTGLFWVGCEDGALYQPGCEDRALYQVGCVDRALYWAGSEDRALYRVRIIPILTVEIVYQDFTSMATSAKPIQRSSLFLILAIVGCLFILFAMLQFLHPKFRSERCPDTPEIPTITVSEEDKTIKNEDKNIVSNEFCQAFQIPDGKSDIIVDVMTQPLANCNIYGTSPQTTPVQPETQAALTLDGKTLYEIINVVPVRRWKELMRLLELRDCDIERIEMDVAQSRDQQYEMLRQWSQQQMASMESVYQALESMNLSGVVEELQTKLLHKTNSPR
ncbi:hypothetical protein chiPu_0011186 [Chiloscyllium punctatum]|uniref:Death domain-containing protein n=1 Tax=Chiloscyllium punctatum TaxID=137246 RepID=A0A401SQT1_CHIPU|nr:hypothetical protein [Chiloscyllium punctatum]